MGLREAMRKAAGLLVELPPEPQEPEGDLTAAEMNDLVAGLDQTAPVPTKTVAQIVHETEGPNLEEIKASPTTPLPVTPEGTADFAVIYQGAGLPAAPFTAEQMLDMLSKLPTELPLDTKRQTVKVTLDSVGKTVGATPETIVADASRKLAALTAYVENLTSQTNEFVTRGEAEISALEAQIEARRKAIQEARHKLTQVTQMCDSESDRLDDVLEFFSLDLPPSKYAKSDGEGTQRAG